MGFQKTAVVVLLLACGCSRVPPPPTDAALNAELAKLPALTPGRWTLRFSLVDFTNEGFPAQAATAIRRDLIRLGQLERSVCFGSAQTAAMQYELWQTLDESKCKVTAFKIQGADYQGTMTCKHQRGTEAVVAMTGTLGAESHRDRLSYEAKAKRDPAKKLRYTIEAVTERTGDCTAPQE